MNAEAISPEEQIRRVARVFLSMSKPPATGEPPVSRPDLRGLIEMLERHLEGDLPPLPAQPGQTAHD
ncbi:hypothetical protein [Tautonia marina]|uniref:hypothetical protein n=1 Tax=Tautonia marina TaxID=2653855 RepID=UPI001260CB48|nr:hypothetical protein [Tautonia marina]